MERDADTAQWYGWHWLCTGRAVLCYIAMQKHNEFSRVKTPRSCDPLLDPLCGGKSTCKLWHRGTDIPAPEGTPILAAHSGTVLVSGWNDSYGNQVLLDNGAGLSTRYAHMTQTAVTAGEAVTAGKIIGYVGSTGDSTGNHLHFEVMQNGVRMNPLELVFAQ